MNKVVKLFEKFPEQKFIYSPTHGEISALQTIATYIGEKLFLINELKTVSKLISNHYYEKDFESIDEIIEKSLNNSWDLSIGNPSLTKPTFGVEYTIDITEPFQYLLDEHNFKTTQLPRIFHSFYINQFLEQFNEKNNLPFIQFPDKYQTRINAMSKSNHDTLQIFSAGEIKGFSDNKIIGKNKTLEIII
jgi:hypothetical protein